MGEANKTDKENRRKPPKSMSFMLFENMFFISSWVLAP